MRMIIIFFIFCGVMQSHAQTSMGIVLEGSVKSLLPSNPKIDYYINFGISLKKNISTEWSLVSGLSYRFFDTDLSTISKDTDMVTHFRDVYPSTFFYITNGEYFRFSYINVPIGLEFKATRFMRLQYQLENNFLVGTTDNVEEYLQYGKKSMSPIMFNHHVSVLLHQNAIGVGLGVIFNPSIIRDDLKYTYQFMSDFNTSFKNAYFFNLTLWGDFGFKKRKKVL